MSIKMINSKRKEKQKHFFFFRKRNKTFHSNSPIIKSKVKRDRGETAALFKKKTTFKLGSEQKNEGGKLEKGEKKKKQSEINDEETLMNFLNNQLKKF